MLQLDLLWLPRATQACERAVLLLKSETDLATGPLPSHHDVHTSREREIRDHAENEVKEKNYIREGQITMEDAQD